MEDKYQGVLSPVGHKDDYYHPELAKAEKILVDKRRKRCWPQEKDPQKEAALLKAPPIGVALSGGGIRSATFCLGVFQSFAKHGFLPKIDFLSTVSGGGYLGSFLGRLFDIQAQDRNKGKSQKGNQFVWEDVKDTLLNPISSPIKWLREHGRYLSPQGPSDNVFAGLVILRNWVAVQAVILSFGLWLVYCVLLLGAGVQMGTDRLPFDVPLSSLLAPTAVVFLLLFLPLGIGYWLCQGEGKKAVPAPPFLTLLAVGFVGIHCALLPLEDNRLRIGGGIVTAVTGMSILLLVCFWGYAHLKGKGVQTAEFLRTRFTKSFVGASWFLGFLFFLFLVDALGNLIYGWLESHWTLGLENGTFLMGGGWAVLAALGKKISSLFTESSKFIPKLSMRVQAGLVAFLWLVAILVVLSGTAEALAWGLNAGGPQDDERILLSDWPRLLEVFAGLTLLCVGLGRTISFLNYSSNHPFYKNRLVNAYLGAANSFLSENKALSREGNDVWMMDYTPHAEGGPLHLINVTINETLDGKSQVEERDRKGVPMAIGPAGLSVGLRHNCLWGEKEGKTDFSLLKPLLNPDKEFHVFGIEKPGVFSRAFGWLSRHPNPDSVFRPVEYLSLGAWFSISGAAFTTGLGAKTSVGLSALLGLANIRLGYWWNSHVSSTRQVSSKGEPLREKLSFWGRRFLNLSACLPVQFGLLDELTARFHGTARQRWYLSDGGHFENTAGYELIRRRVPFIVVCDDGQDVNYGFEDLAGLVLKARNDYQAEITFFGPEDIQEYVHKELHPFVGSPDDFKVKGSQKHALLAWVQYPSDGDGKENHSLILILKPSLSGDEPMDIREYHLEHQDFPQETTMNQFFNEAQWEAYRKLGEHIGEKIFSVKGTGKGWTTEKGNNIPRPQGK
jgi:hypothetical protein